MTAVIEVSGLRMRYDTFEAVRGIDLQVMRGEVFAFLGPNGAGKTTTVEILEGSRIRPAPWPAGSPVASAGGWTLRWP
jgi:ABC-2 type transport system ATP-binding protein